MKPFTEINVKDYELSRVQSAISNAINPVLTAPINDGHLITNIKLVTGTINLVPHGLGRLPQFWMLMRQLALGEIWEDESQTTDRLLALNASANVTVSLWVG